MINTASLFDKDIDPATLDADGRSEMITDIQLAYDSGEIGENEYNDLMEKFRIASVNVGDDTVDLVPTEEIDSDDIPHKSSNQLPEVVTQNDAPEPDAAPVSSWFSLFRSTGSTVQPVETERTELDDNSQEKVEQPQTSYFFSVFSPTKQPESDDSKYTEVVDISDWKSVRSVKSRTSVNYVYMTDLPGSDNSPEFVSNSPEPAPVIFDWFFGLFGNSSVDSVNGEVSCIPGLTARDSSHEQPEQRSREEVLPAELPC
jgi:hypothetical protein